MSDSGDLQVILDALPLMFFQKDTTNNILRANRAAAEAVGTTVASLVGTPTTQWFPDEAGQYFKDDLEVMHSGESRLGIIEPFQVGDPGKHWISTDKFPHFDDAGNVVGILVFIRDITNEFLVKQQRADLEIQVQRTQKLESIGTIAAGVAHDFNNQLMAIMGNIEIAISLDAESEAAKRHMNEALKASQLAAGICNQLLTYAGKKIFQLSPSNLNDLIVEICDLMEVSISKKVRLEIDLAESLPAANIDAAQINQILMNLVANASEAIGEEGGVIKVHTETRYCGLEELGLTLVGLGLEAGHYVCVEVSDSGHGMSSDVLTHIFEPFFTTKTFGSGLGMATVLGSVRAQGGTLKIESAPEVGTVIELLFPAIGESLALSTAETDPRSESVGSGVILVVDDEASVRSVLQTILEAAGYVVLTATDGAEGIATFQQASGRIKAVILDYSMPVLNGVEVFEAISRSKRGIPVLFSSGYPEQSSMEQFGDTPNVDFLQKPYVGAVLLSKLRKLLALPIDSALN